MLSFTPCCFRRWLHSSVTLADGLGVLRLHSKRWCATKPEGTNKQLHKSKSHLKPATGNHKTCTNEHPMSHLAMDPIQFTSLMCLTMSALLDPCKDSIRCCPKAGIPCCRRHTEGWSWSPESKPAHLLHPCCWQAATPFASPSSCKDFMALCKELLGRSQALLSDNSHVMGQTQEHKNSPLFTRDFYKGADVQNF